MADTTRGFDAVFVVELIERYTCPTCQLALKEPQITTCGHHFCESCLKECLGRTLSCPFCRGELKASNEYVFPNRALKREILDLAIRCDQCKKGCEWVGELRQREDHNKQCGYVDEECTNKCGKQVMRKDMKNHLENLCPRRQTSCKHCSSTMEWQKLQDHYKSCPKYPVQCTYSCGAVVARYKMATHVSHQGTCPNSLLDCDFKNIGCLFKGKRSELSAHTKNDVENHLSLTVNKLMATEQKLEETERKLAVVESRKSFSLSAKSPESFEHTWKIENWSQKMLRAKADVTQKVKSSPFYLPQGYHMYLGVYPDYNASSHLGVFLYPEKGDFDGSIQWPFPFSFTLELLDQQPNGKNISRKNSPPYGDEYLVNPAISTKGYGWLKLASHETLETRCYIQDDAILIKLTVHLKKKT
jgi:hypothetical protein